MAEAAKRRNIRKAQKFAADRGYECDVDDQQQEKENSSGSGSEQELICDNNPARSLVGEGKKTGSAPGAIAGSAKAATSRHENSTGVSFEVSSDEPINMAVPDLADLLRNQNEIMMNLANLVGSQPGLREKQQTVSPRKRRRTVHDLSDDEENAADTGTRPSQSTAKKQRLEKTSRTGQHDNERHDLLDGLDQVSDSDADETDTFMEDLQQFFETGDSTAPDLETKMATIVNTSLRASVGEQKINDLCDRLLRPKNCDGLIVPKVNQEIWARLQRFTRNRDLAMQKIQSYMAKAMIPMLKAMQEMREVIKSGRGNTSRTTLPTAQWLTMTSESFRVMALGFVKITNQRKEMIRPDLSENYRQLCSDQNKVTSFLFGDDLGKKIKEIEDSERVGNRVSQQSRDQHFYGRGQNREQQPTHRTTNYKGNSNYAGGKKNFLGYKPSPRQYYQQKN